MVVVRRMAVAAGITAGQAATAIELSTAQLFTKNAGPQCDSLMMRINSLIARFNSLLGPINSLFRGVGNWPVRLWFDALFYCRLTRRQALIR
jgi:hypothetical protein